MVEERVTETRTPEGNTHTHTEVYHDSPRKSGGAGWAIFAVLLLAVLIGGFFLMQGSGAEVAKDNAIAEAAGDVGNAAQSVGDAANDAADNMAN
ncbi:hypothetical protein [Croceicoccus hydrothermalis]|uniref:hypothetical protein n=1 Tax=Croceicoccus hydrothermalis TaxID=2867964 RepID=UPI001EFA450B|nr:hypothetical protein [Croceicoccus hydrothermalis]